ncbi:F-box/LRR-repeat protein 4-like isoform X2 [Ornithodoros turicata]|uniref:F-box/LRR-repeat protein 4-like isoform X2 n=1 Tax=Ornithodoros turicata TaxID=34597 RepID=UPI0031395396
MSSHSNAYILYQDVCEVGSFSSQYGSDNSMSYAAVNVIGPPSVYPDCGDYAETFSTRSYGPWCLDLSIAHTTFSGPLPEHRHVRSQDFLEVQFERAVQPVELKIFETYNPGSIVRILAFDAVVERWKEIWTGKPGKHPIAPALFTPALKNACFQTKAIRLEFYHAHLDYYSQLDAVSLGGVPRLAFRSASKASRHHDNGSSKSVTCTSGFHLLPHELLVSIFSRLDLQSILTLSRCCTLFKKVCYDQVFYRVLDLQPYWEKVTDAALKCLRGRCCSLQKLNLSWCGAHGTLTSDAFVRFVEATGAHLRCLCLSCCPFVDYECLKTIANECPNIEDLELRSCIHPLLNRLGFLQISRLSKLVRLDLYRTQIEMFALISIIRSCSLLEYLCLGSCAGVNNYDDIALEIGTYLRSCTGLVDLDFGWCSSIESTCIQELVQDCPNLRRLYLTSIRTVCDADLNAIASYCRNLEQLDILGSTEATAVGVQWVLSKCKHLVLLDVSFCCRISVSSVEGWRDLFPAVHIKQSVSHDSHLQIEIRRL